MADAAGGSRTNLHQLDLLRRHHDGVQQAEAGLQVVDLCRGDPDPVQQMMRAFKSISAVLAVVVGMSMFILFAVYQRDLNDWLRQVELNLQMRRY